MSIVPVLLLESLEESLKTEQPIPRLTDSNADRLLPDRTFWVHAMHSKLWFGTVFGLLSVSGSLSAGAPTHATLCDDGSCDQSVATSCEDLPNDDLGLAKTFFRNSKPSCDWRFRTPAMMGDFYAGSMGFRADSVLDRLVVVADDLDAPFVLPPNSSILTISEPGPVGVFSTTLQSSQQLQALLRAGSPIPGATLVGIVNSNATLTTSQTIAQIQSQLASTGQAFDIIAIQPPPGAYNSAVNAVFLTRNALPGTTRINAGDSGAFLQGGVDTLTGGEDFDAYYFYDYIVRFNTALADASSGGVGRMKIAEGGTILPQDRFFFRYSYLDNVRYSNAGQNLNRYVPGFEKSFGEGMVSVEVRAPFAANTVTSSTLNGDMFSSGSDTRFGNLTVYLKSLLLDTEKFALSGGLGVVTPTASDTRVSYANGTPLLSIQNDSVRLQPFLGGLYTPNDRLFVQSFLQWDGAASGNQVAINSTGTGLTSAGRITDPSNLFLDIGAGYWLYRSDETRGLTGIIPMVELHQNSALQPGDVVTAGPFQVGNFNGTTSLTNIVAGTTFEFAKRSNLTASYVGPIGGGSDRQFDGGLQMFYSFNRK
jgi:hypothetical protein